MSKTSKKTGTDNAHEGIAPVVGPDTEHHYTDSGIDVRATYDESDLRAGLDERLGEPGEYPFTRGVHPDMYRSRLWTMRQYAGYSTAEETNKRYRYLLEHGSTGLSMAFDLPTQLGLDSDDDRCLGEVGRTGVPISSLEDMRIAIDKIPLDKVSTSMTITGRFYIYQTWGTDTWGGLSCYPDNWPDGTPNGSQHVLARYYGNVLLSVAARYNAGLLSLAYRSISGRVTNDGGGGLSSVSLTTERSDGAPDVYQGQTRHGVVRGV